MNPKATLVTFVGADDVHPAVSVEVGKDGVLGRRRFAYGDSGPVLFDVSGPGVKVDTNDASLFPTSHEVRQIIAVDIGETDPVGAPRRIVDDVPRPGVLVGGPGDLTGPSEDQGKPGGHCISHLHESIL